jgi:hypothetical protein
MRHWTGPWSRGAVTLDQQSGPRHTQAVAESLAEEIESGEYRPTELSDCERELTPDRSAQSVSLTEFTLFEGRRRGDSLPRYASVQPQMCDPDDVKKRISHYRESVVEPFIERWLKRVNLEEVAPDEDRDVARIRASLIRLAKDSARPVDAKSRLAPLWPDLGLGDDALRDRYKAWRRLFVDNLVRDELRRLSAAMGSQITPAAERGELNTTDLADALTDLAYPSQYQQYGGPHALVALCTTFQQVWIPKGYTRGELIGSLSLAPGERLTLEVHSWNKATTRSEAELAVEFEMRTSEKHTQRDALTVLQEYATKQNTKVEARGTIPIPQFPLSVGAQADIEAQRRLNRTSEKIREDVIEAASVLKLNRKLKIESSRETGRDEKQTRVIENTNRCHTLNCHYFEVVFNYIVHTRPVDVEPCVLLRNPRQRFTRDLILCHEGILRRSLLDRAFLSGFEAARTLAILNRTDELENKRRLERLEMLGQQLEPYAQSIADSYEALEASFVAFENAIQISGLNQPFDVATQLTPLQIDRVWTHYGLANHVHVSLRRLSTDLAGIANAGDVLRGFLAVAPPGLPPRRYYDAFIDLNTQLGVFPYVPSDGGDVTGPFPWRLSKDLVDCDDAGLRAAVTAAANALRSAPMPDFTELTQVPAHDVATAEVDFEKLQCHLESNWMHYNQAIWAQESYDQRLERLRWHGPVLALIENRLLGFLGDYAAYPLRTLNAVPVVDLEGVLLKMREGLKEYESIPVHIPMPSDGQVLEATVGECDACEPYIDHSRLIDLRLQSANADKAEAEALRLSRRVDAGDFTDPNNPNARLGIDLRTGN